MIATGLLGDDGYLDTGMISAFTDWLKEAISRLVLAGGWQEPYTRSAYMRGLNFADSAVKSSEIPVRPVEVLGLFLYQAEVEALNLKAASDLANIGRALVGEVEALLAGVLTDGLTNASLEALILGRVDKIGVTRATVMAVTGVVGAVAEGTLSRLEGYGIDRVGALVELTTAGKPCPLCVGLRDRENGLGPGVYTVEQARGVIPAHPRCRCRWTPLVGVK